MMKPTIRIFLITAFLLLCRYVPVHAQYMPADIIAKADSTVIAAVGQDIFDRYYERWTTNFYEYRPRPNSTKTKQGFLSEYRKGVGGKPTKGILHKARVWYTVRLGEPDCLNADVRVEFDSVLAVSSPADTAVIPQYVRDGKPCNFISKERAAELAEAFFNEKAYYTTTLGKAEADYIVYHFDSYCWSAWRKLWEAQDHGGEPYGEIECAYIDAVTGEPKVYDIHDFGDIPLME